MRAGNNPSRDASVPINHFNHLIVIPVYIPHLKEYYTESFEVFKLSVQSIVLTSHKKSFITVVCNGCCSEVENYVQELYQAKKIHECIFTDKIGKINSILKGLSGSNLPLITITDADVLFLNGWQKAVYEVYQHIPKTGVVGTTPNPFLSFTNTQHVLKDNIWNSKLEMGAIACESGTRDFYQSIGELRWFDTKLKGKYVLLTKGLFKAVVGAGHYAATYRGALIDATFFRYSEFSLGGKSEFKLLDNTTNIRDCYRLSTFDNYTFHMGNTVEEKNRQRFNQLVQEKEALEVPVLCQLKSTNRFGAKLMGALLKQSWLRSMLIKNYKKF